MPGLDNTGPEGEGPLTGGGFGDCIPQEATTKNRPRGAGRGAGRGRRIRLRRRLQNGGIEEI